MIFITYNKLNNDIVNNIYRIPKDVDLIVGIPRSGLVLANIIALYLNKPLTDLESFISGKIYNTGTTKNLSNVVNGINDVNKVLIVDDSVSSGKAIITAKNKISSLTKEYDFLFLAAYVRSTNQDLVDIFFDVIDEDRVFEWNYMHNNLLEKACLDIDGVLCIDPNTSQNDDGVRYREFIKTARPKMLPSRPVGYIVSSRLEKYRVETEKWLAENGIEYKKLYLMNVSTAEERRRLGSHGRFKAEVFQSIKDAEWFIESEESQAIEIAKTSGKMVFCTENQTYYEPGTRKKLQVKIQQTLPNKVKGIVKRAIPSPFLKFYRKIFRR